MHNALTAPNGKNAILFAMTQALGTRL